MGQARQKSPAVFPQRNLNVLRARVRAEAARRNRQKVAQEKGHTRGPLAWCGPSSLRRRFQYKFTRPDL
jgi:hypothetical protein